MFKLTIFRSYVGSATLAIAAVAGALLAAVGMSAAHAQTCPFDSGGSTLENDGLVLTRYALGLRGAPMLAIECERNESCFASKTILSAGTLNSALAPLQTQQNRKTV